MPDKRINNLNEYSKEAIYRNLIESCVEGILLVDESGEILMANPSAEKIFKYQKGELVGKTVESLLPKDLRRHHNSYRQSYNEHPKTRKMGDSKDLYGLTKEGNTFPVQVSLSPIKFKENTFIMAFISDISILKKERQHRDSLAKIINESLNEIYIYGAENFNFHLANKSALSNLGYSLEDLKKKAPYDIYPEFTRDDFIKFINPLISGEQDNKTFETIHQRVDGSLYPVEVHLQKSKIDNEGVYLAIVLDISLRKKYQGAIMDSILEGQEIERRRFAKELHDGLGQKLAAINLHVHNVMSRLEEMEADEDAQFSCKKAVDLMDLAIHEVRSISHNLTPVDIEKFGLVNAINSLCNDLTQSGKMIANFSFNGDFNGINRDIDIGLYRIAQELLNNVVKHAKAKNANVQLNQNGKKIELIVSDNGVGFDFNKVSEGIGLKNILGRVEMLHGKTNFNITKGKGSLVSIEIPLL